MKLRIAILDDERPQIEFLRSSAHAWAETNSHACEISTFPSAEAFRFAYSGDKRFDILLLDVEMAGQNGIDLAKQLRKEGDRSEIIFITSHFEFYGEGYEVDALHYLVKPVDPGKLFSVLTKAVERLSVEPPYVIVRCDGITEKLYEQDILYIESLLHYIVIRTAKREYRIKENLTDFADRLTDDFYRTHRSYFVSLKHVARISRTSVTLDNGQEIPLSRGKYDEINRAYIERN